MRRFIPQLGWGEEWSHLTHSLTPILTQVLIATSSRILCLLWHSSGQFSSRAKWNRIEEKGKEQIQSNKHLRSQGTLKRGMFGGCNGVSCKCGILDEVTWLPCNNLPMSNIALFWRSNCCIISSIWWLWLQADGRVKRSAQMRGARSLATFGWDTNSSLWRKGHNFLSRAGSQ